MNPSNPSLDSLCINTLRFLAADSVQKAQSGHPGTPLGIAPLVYVLWTRFLRHSPSQASWPDRDRFVLSSGHASSLLYALLHLSGYDLSLADLMAFRQLNSRTPGHPELHRVPGIETTTGPLGQGFANAVGMAAAEAHLSSVFNQPGTPEIVNHFTYVVASDGDLMEGLSSEAASLAGHLRLGKLICLYDDNQITIEGSTALTFTEDRLKRFEAYGWHIQHVEDGNDLGQIEAAVQKAQAERSRPSLISIKTVIGYGTPTKAGKSSAHAGPLGEEELRTAKETLNWPTDKPFFIPEQVKEFFSSCQQEGEGRFLEWQDKFEQYSARYPTAAAEFRRRVEGQLPPNWEASLPAFEASAAGQPTRIANEPILNCLANSIPELIGGSADLAPATMTMIHGSPDFDAASYFGRNIHFGVREHAMAGIMNGMQLHGGLIPYGATFLVFSDYMRPALRMAAMMGLQEIFIFTHDSIGLGEDGPTHQPVEQMAGLRSIPKMVCIRPCDQNEVVEAWRAALNNRNGPTSILLTRQPIPILDRAQYPSARHLEYGAYILAESSRALPDLILIATGSEVHLALEAQQILLESSVQARVVAMPSWELFKQQPVEYQERVLPNSVKARIAIEAGSPFGWERWVGEHGAIIALDGFGASAPCQALYEKFGFTAENIVETAFRVLRREKAVQ